MDFIMNVLLNMFEFLGIQHANQIIIFIIIMAFGLIYKIGEMAKWVIGIFLVIMTISLGTAIYQIMFDARAQCVYAYDETKPVIPDSSERALSWGEIRTLNCPSIWVARNEIYYRTGYCFYSNAGYSYFETGRTCTHDEDGPTSSGVGWKNIKLLKKLEARKGCRIPPSSCRDLSKVPSSKLIVSRPPLKSD